MICFYFFSNLKKRQFKEHNAIILNIIHNAFNLRDTDVFMNNCQRQLKGQSRKDNPEILPTLGTYDEDK